MRLKPVRLKIGKRVTALLILAASACSGSPTDSEADLLVDFVLGGESAERLQADVEARRHDLTLKCMLAEGFDYQLPAVEEFDRDSAPSNRSEIGFGWVASLREFEAGELLGPPETRSSEGQKESDSSLSGEAFDAAMDGVDGEPGCAILAWNQAKRELGLTELRAVASQVSAELEGWYNSPEAFALQEAWSGCMSERGFDYRSVDSMTADIEQRWHALRRAGNADDDLLVVEIAMYKADRDCSQELDARFRELVTEAADRVVEKRQLASQESLQRS